MHGLAGDEDVELIRIEDQLVAAAAVERLPEIENIVLGLLVDIDYGRVMLATITDQAIRITLEIDRQRDTAAGHVRRRGCDQRFGLVQMQEFRF
ncbi:hypothetical protein D3C86_1935210 [compost metagenome]